MQDSCRSSVLCAALQHRLVVFDAAPNFHMVLGKLGSVRTLPVKTSGCTSWFKAWFSLVFVEHQCLRFRVNFAQDSDGGVVLSSAFLAVLPGALVEPPGTIPLAGFELILLEFNFNS